MGKQRRLATNRRREVAGEVGNRQLHAGGGALATDAIVHPRAATLVGTRIEIEIETASGLAARFADFINAHVRVPDIHALQPHDDQSVKAFDERVQSGHNPGFGKVRAQVFLG